MSKRSHHKVTKSAKGHKEPVQFKYTVRDDAGVVIAQAQQWGQAMAFAAASVARAMLANVPDRPKRWACVEWIGESGSRWYEIIRFETITTSTAPDFSASSAPQRETGSLGESSCPSRLRGEGSKA